MSHAPIKRERVRAAYVYKRLSLEVAAAVNGVSFASAQNWKARAKRSGDDWDLQRASNGLTFNCQDETNVSLLNDFITLFQSTQEVLRDDETLQPLEKVQAIASLADSFSKTMKQFQRLLPEAHFAVVAESVVNLLAQFIHEHYPQHLEAFCEILEPFAGKLADYVKELA